MQDSRNNIYHEKADSFRLESADIRKKLNLYSILRLAFFALAIFLFASLLSINLVFAIAAFLAAISMLLLYVKLGGKLATRKTLLSELIRINEDEILALKCQYGDFNPGSEYIAPEHYNSSDLDLFGNNSLFQFLERTSISSGRDQLAEWLSNPAPIDNIEERQHAILDIKNRQDAVLELSGKLDWRQEFLAKGRLSGETRKDSDQLGSWLNESPFIISSRTYRYLLLILPLVTILSFIASFWWIPDNIPVIFVLIQLGIVGYSLRKINSHHGQVSRKFNIINNLSSLIGLIEDEEFNSEYLISLREGLSSSGIKAGEQLRRLAGIVIQFDWRLNLIMGFLLNAALMWDLQCILRLEKWKAANAREVPGWINIMGKFEALNSFANFRFNNIDSIFPEISDGEFIIKAESISHPLIPQEESVSNDISINRNGEFMLITGSNMAGKSTFLRTIGINMVLAAAGAPVIADSMIWSPVRVLTSMRVRDSLSSRESTFYAELKRLRMIIEEIQAGKKVLIILDEILKGTNSRDKHFGSEMLIRQLVREGSAGLIATHDLELSILEEEFPLKILNFSFEVQIENQEFVYDYKLRRGVCQTLNATELMKKMGISIDHKTKMNR